MNFVNHIKHVFSKTIKSNFLNNTLKLSSITLLANIVVFLIPLYIAREYSISTKTDSFFLSYGIIVFISTIFSGAVRAVSVPYLTERISDNINFNLFISSVLKYASLAILMLCLILSVIFYTVYYVTESETYRLLLISIPIIFFTIISSFFYGILNSLKSFYSAELSPLTRGVVILLCIYLFKAHFGITAVIIGYIMGELAKFLHLLFLVIKKKNVKINLRITNFAVVKDFAKQGFYQMFATTLSSASPLTDRIVASFLVAGSISLLDYGDKIFIVFGVLFNSFLVLLLSKWSLAVSTSQFSIHTVHKTLKYVFLSTLILFIVVYFMDENIVHFLYPTLNIESKKIIALILTLNTLGLIFNSLSLVINRATIALKNTKIMVKTSFVRLISNILLDLIFIKLWGVIGIVVATIGVHIIGLSLNYYLFYKNNSLKKV